MRDPRPNRWGSPWRRRATLAFICFSLVSSCVLAYSYLTSPNGLVHTRHRPTPPPAAHPVLVALSFLLPLIEAGVLMLLFRPWRSVYSLSIGPALLSYVGWLLLWAIALPTDLPIVFYLHQLWAMALLVILGAGLLSTYVVNRTPGGRGSQARGNPGDVV